MCASLGQRDAISRSIEQGESELRLETFDRSENGWLRAKQLVRSGLEATCAYYRIEATELMKRHFFHYRNSILSYL